MRFTKGKLEIPFDVVNVAWLERYEKWLRANGNKETTISLMFRTLHSTYNKLSMPNAPERPIIRSMNIKSLSSTLLLKSEP